MISARNQDWQALLAADTGYAAWMAKDEEERMAAILEEEEARHHPYGPAEADCGYSWEGEAQCKVH